MVGQHQQALLEWTVPLSVEQVLYLAARLNLVAEHNRPCAVLKTDIHSHSGLLVFPLSELTLSYTSVQELMHTDMHSHVMCDRGDRLSPAPSAHAGARLPCAQSRSPR
jgi:hypothetical protein